VLSLLFLFSQHFGVGAIPWSPIARGLLTRPLSQSSDSKRGETERLITVYKSAPGAEKIIERVEEIAKKRDVSMAQVAIAWCLSKDGNLVSSFTSKPRPILTWLWYSPPLLTPSSSCCSNRWHYLSEASLGCCSSCPPQTDGRGSKLLGRTLHAESRSRSLSSSSKCRDWNTPCDNHRKLSL
jgi:hypothetical protein